MSQKWLIVVLAALVSLSTFACSGSSGGDGPCADEPCSGWCDVQVKCFEADRQECMNGCVQMDAVYQNAYCVCFTRLDEKYGCDVHENDEIIEGELSDCMRAECTGCQL